MKEILLINEIVEISAKKYSSHKAIKALINNQEINISYHEFYNAINGYSNNLNQICGKRVKIALFAPNGFEWIISYFSIISSNNIVVPLDINWDLDTVLSTLKQFEIMVIMVGSNVNTNFFEKISEEGYYVLFAGNYQSLLAAVIHLEEKNRINNNDCSVLYFTSGTMGEQKAVMLNQRQLISNCYGIDDILKFEKNSSLLNVLPFHHSFAVMCDLIYAVYIGATLCIADLKTFTKDLRYYKPHYIFAVPLIVENILKYLNIQKSRVEEGVNVKNHVVGENLKAIICGGAMIRKELTEELAAFGIQLIRGYGITECSPVVAVIKSNEEYDDISVGIPIKCNLVKIIDNEIAVKGSNVMLGYYMNEKETTNAFIDGWFRTGDLGYLDKNNKLYITGRKKHLIILGNGENISIEEIESGIESTEEFDEYIVFEERNKKGEHFLAILISSKNKNENVILEERIENIILEFNKKNKLRVQIKKIYTIEYELPRTSTKKIQRKKSIILYIKQVILNNIVLILDDFLFVKHVILLETELYNDLGLDSFELLRLICCFEEKLGIEINLEESRKFITIRNIIDYLVAKHTNVDNVSLEWKMNL